MLAQRARYAVHFSLGSNGRAYTIPNNTDRLIHRMHPGAASSPISCSQVQPRGMGIRPVDCSGQLYHICGRHYLAGGRSRQNASGKSQSDTAWPAVSMKVARARARVRSPSHSLHNSNSPVLPILYHHLLPVPAPIGEAESACKAPVACTAPELVDLHACSWDCARD